jgi:N utilization substance protein B
MSLHPQKLREMTLQLVFSKEFDLSDEEMIPFMMHELKVTKKSVKEAFERAELIMQKKEVLDEEIKAISVSYGFNRIPKVELSILRLALYEMLFIPEIPAPVSIAEGLRLAKKFATEESMTYINAILDQFYKKHELHKTSN